MKKIEIPGVALLGKHRKLIEELNKRAATLRLDRKWHFLLDLSGIRSQLEPLLEIKALCAGAGRTDARELVWRFHK